MTAEDFLEEAAEPSADEFLAAEGKPSAAAFLGEQPAKEPEKRGWAPMAPDPRALNPLASMTPEERHTPILDASKLVPKPRTGPAAWRPGIGPDPRAMHPLSFMDWMKPIGEHPNPLGATAQTMAGLVNYFMSPQGSMEAMAAATPLGPAVGAKWMYDMIKGAVESGKEVARIYNEPGQLTPEKQQEMLAHITGASAMGLGVGGLVHQGVHGARQLLPEKPKPVEEVSEFGGAPKENTDTHGPTRTDTGAPAQDTPGDAATAATAAKSEPTPAKPAPVETALADPQGNPVPVRRIGAGEIATRADLMQFKRMDEAESGVNAADRLQGKWDDLKAGNLLLWEPMDPAAYGLQPGQKYIVANGHHRYEFGDRSGVKEYNAQVVREADGLSAQDARALAAEINIADGKGTVYDQVKFLRNESATHGQDAAVARAERIGIKGRQAATLAFQAGPDLYTSFINEQLKPETAEAIAKAAPLGTAGAEGLQRLGIQRAIEGAGGQEIANLIQAVRVESKAQTAEQFDLFAADDTALQAAAELAAVAGRIQGEVSREIRSTDSAARNAQTAAAKGVKFDRPPAEILAENERLKFDRERWNNWALHPELVQQVRDYAAMARAKGLPPKKGMVAGTKAEAWADEVIASARQRTNAAGDPRLAAAGILKAAAIIERFALDSFDAFVAAAKSHLPAGIEATRDLFQQAREYLAGRMRNGEDRETLAREPRLQKARADEVVKRWQNDKRVKFSPFRNAGTKENPIPAEPITVRDVIDDGGRGRHIDSEGQIRNEQQEAKRIWEEQAKSGEFPGELLEATGEPGWFAGGREGEGLGYGVAREVPESGRGTLDANSEAARVNETPIPGREQRGDQAGRNDSPSRIQSEPGSLAERAAAALRDARAAARAAGKYQVSTFQHPIRKKAPTSGQVARYSELSNRAYETRKAAEVLAAELMYERGRVLEDLARAIPRNEKGLVDRQSKELSSYFEADLRLDEAIRMWSDARSISSIVYPPHSHFLALVKKLDAEMMAGRKSLPEYLDAMIEATDPLGPARRGELQGGLALPKWMALTVANTALRAAKLAYTTTRDLAQAIAAGIDHVRALNLPGFVEAEVRDWLINSLGERATGQKILDSGLVSEGTKSAVTEYLYERRKNATDQAAADAILREIGLEQAWALWKQPTQDLPGAVRSKLLGSITRQLAAEERGLRASGDAQGAEAAAQHQARIWNEALPAITNQAQALQAMRDMVAMSPDAQVARAGLELEHAAGRKLDQVRPEIEQARVAIEQGRATGLEAVRNDPATNAAAREAVNTTVKESAETHKAIVMDLAEPWASSSEVLRQAREQVRLKANELLNRSPRPPGLSANQYLRQIMDDLAQRAATIFAGHIQGSEPGTGIVEKLQARLGLTREKAGHLAVVLEREWKRQVDAAKKKLDERLAKARARQLQKEEELQTQDAVDRAIRKQLQEWNTRLGEVIRQEATRRDQTGVHVAERVVQTSGLKGEAAEKLRATLERRWNELVAEAQQAALEGIQARSGVKVGRQVRNAFDKVLELDRLGALSSTAFYDVVQSALKLKNKLTAQEAAELRRLAKAAAEAPAGWQQQRAQARVLTYVERLKGELGWIDAPWAIWYANIFSGPPTHAANVIGNTTKLIESIALEMIHRPVATPQILGAAVRGAGRGLQEARSIMTTGSVEGTRLLKAEASRPLEALTLPGSMDYLLTPWRTVTRAMASEDMVAFKANEEIRWTLLAREIARREGLPMWGETLNKRVQDLLYKTKEQRESARAQAAAEGLTGAEARRRAAEILEQRREEAMPGSTDMARQYALKQTYNAEPYGLVGSVAEVLNLMNNRLVVTRFAVPVIRIMANVTNESLNYFPPIALTRVALSKWGPAQILNGRVQFRNRIDGQPIAHSDQMFNLTAQAALGTALFGGLVLALANDLHQVNPALAVYGQGPRDKAQREQLRAAGWIPNSVKVGGRYFSYQETQLGVPFAILGNYFDAVRWQNLEEEDALNRVAFAINGTAFTVLDQRMLSGLRDVLTWLGNGSKGDAGDMAKALSRPAAGFVVPNAVRWVDQVFDPAVYEADTVQGALMLQVPWARRENRAALNAFGEPVKRGPFERFTAPEKPDLLVQVLATKGAWVPMPNLQQLTVGDKNRGADYSRPMRPEEYYELIQESGIAIREKLEYQLERIMAMEPEEAQGYVRRVASEERAKVMQKFKWSD